MSFTYVNITNNLGIIALSMVRVAPMFIGGTMSPVGRFPTTIKLVTIIAFSLVALNINQHADVLNASTEFSSLALMIISEFLIGITLAFSVQSAMSALATLGRLTDMQLGLGAAGIFDPSSKNQQSIIGMGLLMLAGLMFFELNIHQDFLAFVTLSYRTIALGSNLFHVDTWVLINTLSAHYLIATMALLPAILAVFITDVLIAFSAKTMPQMNIYFVGLPLKIGVGLLVLSATMRHLLPSFERLFSKVFESWNASVVTG